MKLIKDRLHPNGLFMKMFLVTVALIILVAVAVTFAIIRMAEQFFVEKFSITNSQIINQIQFDFEELNYSIVMAASDVDQSSTIEAFLSKEEPDNERMQSLFHVMQQVDHLRERLGDQNVEIAIADQEKITYTTNFTYWPADPGSIRGHDITETIAEQPNRLLYFQDSLEANDYVIAAKALHNRETNQSFGAVYFPIKEGQLRSFYMDYVKPGNDFYVVDNNGKVVSSSSSSVIGQSLPELSEQAKNMKASKETYREVKFQDTNQIMLAEYLPYFDMYLVNMVDKQTAVGNLVDTKQIVLLLAGVVFLALIIVFLVTKRLTNSLSKLVQDIEAVPKKGLQRRLLYEGTYETKQIGLAFNSMMDELQVHVEKLIEAQKQQRQAELAALQQQINPHFLYNTMASIKFLVMMGEKGEAERTMDAFITLLQNTIGNVDEAVTVEMEVENLKNYVVINQKRYGDRVQVQFMIAPDCMDYRIPKLILQPFIENSFFHAFNKTAQGTITVLVWCEADDLLCEIADDGDGMAADTKSLPNTNRNRQLFCGIGVKNVHERIQLLYGPDYGVSITSQEGHGTRVKLRLPASKESERNII
ncbi:two-component system, sensor histidine kinase YesM [Terribacillus halophilus]|uniref:Two-component system, sensor histidine kinase YesM n=1 Tax=Terribacillus halophilus TaxID=361279 RepID=A0A1G6PR47_9BACI|nr:sensor histidine kinase [Terribacillus halophilus]SDC82518.1 two-component system, sensor histidine kinase YesM [Terribacillus halophilus]